MKRFKITFFSNVLKDTWTSKMSFDGTSQCENWAYGMTQKFDCSIVKIERWDMDYETCKSHWVEVEK